MYVIAPQLERDVAVLKPNPFQLGVISSGSVSGGRVRSLPDLGEALVNVLQMLTMSDRYATDANIGPLIGILDELNTYIHYVNKQETTLNEIEQQKESFKNIYFAKDNKDK